MASSRTVVIVIDGLDECSDPASVLDALAIGIEAVSVRLRVLVCSRPYAAIQSKFKNTPLYHLASQNHFHDINPETLSNDVAAFLTWSLGEIASRPANSNLPTPWPTKHQLDELIERASGLFIIASTYEKYINDPTEDNPAAQLNRILSRKRVVGSSPLAELDALYDQVLDDLRRSLIMGPELVFARDIVESVILALGKMSLDAPAGLFTVEPSNARSVLRRLTAVILLPEDQTDAITPFHASFGEYIQDDARCTIRELSVDTTNAHGRVADRCIAAVASAARNGIIGVEYMYADTIPLHLECAGGHLPAHVASSPRNEAAVERLRVMEGGIWTWLHLMSCGAPPKSLKMIRDNVEIAGFEGLLRIEGIEDDAAMEVSIGSLMIADHVSAINHSSELSLQLAAPATTAITVPRSDKFQTIKFNPPKVGDNLVYVLDVRHWNKHNYPKMFIQRITVDLNSLALTPVELLVSSSVTLQGLLKLSKYLETRSDSDTISKIRLALDIAKDACYFHEASPLHGFGWPLSDYIVVSAEGIPIFYPDSWAVPSYSSASPNDGTTAEGLRILETELDSTSFWDPPEHIDRRYPDDLRGADLWDFGCVLYWIFTGSGALTRYKDLAVGHAELGYNQEKESIPDEYWARDSVQHQARYEQAVLLLPATIEGHDEIKGVLKTCWALKAEDRPSMREVVERLTSLIDAESAV